MVKKSFNNFTIIGNYEFLRILLTPYLERIKLENKQDLGEIVRKSTEIADEFLAVFSGYFSEESLFVCGYDENKEMPWFDKVFERIVEKDDLKLLVETVADRQLEGDFDREKWWNTIYEINSDKRETAQELAVAGLIAIDVFFDEILKGNTYRAFYWYGEVYSLLSSLHSYINIRVFKNHSDIAKNGANKRHDMPNGTRAKRKNIVNLWASGKYSSRDICAEQECAALGMSYSTARKALIGTPEPVSRC